MTDMEKIEKEPTKPTKKHNDPDKITAGEMLYNARTNGRRKRELPTIARQLCIREEFLEALERGDYATIPETIYILGFARNYALELGLDSHVVVAKIKQEIAALNKSAADEIGEIVIKHPVCSHRKTIGYVASGTVSFVRKNWKLLVTAVGALVIITIAITLIPVLSGGRNTSATVPGTPEIAANPRVEPAYKLAVREQFGPENRDTANVILQANSEAWLKVEDSRGETLFSRVLTAGDVYYAPAGGAIATTGNAGGLDLYVNGERAPNLGAKGARRGDIKLTPEGLMPPPVETIEE